MTRPLRLAKHGGRGSENIDWFCELRADSGKTLNSRKTNNIFTTSSRREWRSSKHILPERKFAKV